MNCHVLLIEDDRDIRETFSRVLELNGHTVVSAQNATEAVETLAELDELGLILLDLLLPDANGWAVRKQQLERQLHADVPVVVISGAASELKTEVSALGAVDGLTKPISLNQLLGAVEEHCRSTDA